MHNWQIADHHHHYDTTAGVALAKMSEKLIIKIKHCKKFICTIFVIRPNEYSDLSKGNEKWMKAILRYLYKST